MCSWANNPITVRAAPRSSHLVSKHQAKVKTLHNRIYEQVADITEATAIFYMQSMLVIKILCPLGIFTHFPWNKCYDLFQTPCVHCLSGLFKFGKNLDLDYMKWASYRFQTHHRYKKRVRRTEIEKLSQTAGEAEWSEEQKSVWDGVFLAEFPEALHIPCKINWSCFCFVLFQTELPPDYGETAVHPLPPDSACVIMHRATTKTNIQCLLALPRRSFHAFLMFFLFHKLSLISITINKTNQTR